MSLPIVPPDGIVPDKDQSTDLASIGFVLCVDALVPREIIGSQEGFRTLIARVVSLQRMGLEMSIQVILAKEAFLTLVALEKTFFLFRIVLLVGVDLDHVVATGGWKTAKGVQSVVVWVSIAVLLLLLPIDVRTSRIGVRTISQGLD